MTPTFRGLAGEAERDGGAVSASYRDPFGGRPVLLVAVPVDGVEPTPYQRDPSATHVKRLMGVIGKIGPLSRSRFSRATSFDDDDALDKIIASAAKFNVDRVKQEEVARGEGGGAPPEEE